MKHRLNATEMYRPAKVSFIIRNLGQNSTTLGTDIEKTTIISNVQKQGLILIFNTLYMDQFYERSLNEITNLLIFIISQKRAFLMKNFGTRSFRMPLFVS